MLTQVKYHNFFTGNISFSMKMLFICLFICSPFKCLFIFLNIRLPSNDGNASKGKQQTSEPVHILKRSFARTVSVVSNICIYYLSVLIHNSIQYLSLLLYFSLLVKECFDSLLSILHWSWTTLVLGVEELRGLKGFQYTATLLDLERLRFVGTCCLRLLRVYICEIFPIAGEHTLDLSN